MTNAEIISKCIKKSLGSNGYFITNTEPGTEIKLCGLFSKPDTSVLDQCRELKKTYQLQGSHSEEAIADSIVKAGTHYTTLLMSNSFADRQRAVETIMTTSQKSKKGHDIIQLSFATKYSAFASVNGKEMPNEDKVIIYDSYVFAFLVAAQNIFHYFDTPDKMGPKQPKASFHNYLIFCDYFLAFREAFDLQSVSLRAIDWFLWYFWKNGSSSYQEILGRSGFPLALIRVVDEKSLQQDRLVPFKKNEKAQLRAKNKPFTADGTYCQGLDTDK